MSAITETKTQRQQFERRQRRRSSIIAALSTVVVVGALIIAIPRLPRWPRVKESFFSKERLFDSFPRLLDAFVLDIKIFAWSTPAIIALALLLAIARSSRNPALFPIRIFVIGYIDIMRGVPVILWIYLIGFGVPGVGLERPFNSPLLWGSVALVLTYGAYIAEVFRAGIDSVHESQRAASRSLGLSNTQTMRFVILPQAIRRVVPPLMNDLVSLQKDVALVSLIGPIEILRQAGIDKAKFANFTPYVAAAIIFLMITIPLTRTTDYLLARERRRTSSTRVR
ncbi:MAG: amino acid ABC transporter permease [Actinobacteria bacterium]|nr:amino acid ABC transporter permease [Acidimicrobiia bacterium]NDA96743.1 amino acid ABC transporter permease [Actinomycetota bacterium]NDC99879.1 amino acid ABC transporter permease [bacterium]HBQ51440.1 ABC transporter permease [Acidimicrobium sp.]NDB27636.1 amino acid ABC transporter permease [Actinomycetota bacterium]